MKMRYMRITGDYRGERASVVFQRKTVDLPWDVIVEHRGICKKYHAGKDIRPCPTHATMILDHVINNKPLRGNLSVRPHGAKLRLAK